MTHKHPGFAAVVALSPPAPGCQARRPQPATRTSIESEGRG